MAEDVSSVIRVMLVDDHRMVLAGLRVILGTEPGVEIVAEAANGAQAVELAAAVRPDVVCMDVQMPVMDGIEATRRICAVPGRSARVLMLTTFRDELAVEASLRAGASGFVLKNSPPETLIEAIRVVHAGDALLDPQVTRAVIEAMRTAPGDAVGYAMAPGAVQAAAGAGADGGQAQPQGGFSRGQAQADEPPRPAEPPELRLLTEREHEVLLLLAEGLSNSEIAQRIYVSDATVKTHVSNLLAKLGVNDRVQAVIYAYDRGIVLPRG